MLLRPFFIEIIAIFILFFREKLSCNHFNTLYIIVHNLLKKLALLILSSRITILIELRNWLGIKRLFTDLCVGC